MNKITLLFLFMLLQLSYINSQTKQIEGKVIDKDSEHGINSAHIQSVGDFNHGTISNEDGYFVLNIKKQTDTLIFSHIGYETKKYPIVKTKEVLNIKLTPRKHELGEVVVEPIKADSIIEKVIDRLSDNHRVEPVYYRFYTRYIRANTKDSVLHTLGEFTGKIHFSRRLINPLGNQGGYEIMFTKNRMGAFSEKGVETTGFDFIHTKIPKGADNIFGDMEDFLHRRRSRNYNYWLEAEVLVKNRPCYVIYFNTDNETTWNRGKLYIDKKTYGIVKKEKNSRVGSSTKIKEFNYIDGMWYLKKAVLSWGRTVFTERLTVYNLIEKPDDKDEFSRPHASTSLHKTEDNNFYGDFDDSFWEDNDFVPLPRWIKSIIKNSELH